MKKDRLFVCGDLHIPYDIKKLSSKKWPEQKKLTKNDVLIQLGDFGGIWYDFGKNKEQEYWLDWLAEKNFTTAVVLGNHENYDLIEQLPEEEKWGGEVKVIKRKGGDIYILERGALYNINGRSILTIGGATSVDKHLRLPGVSWWEQETLSKREIDNAFDAMEACGYKCDYILTHTCPSRILLYFIRSYNKTKCHVSQFLDEVDNRMEFKEWHFGHLHVDDVYEEVSDDGKQKGVYMCHYNGEPYELE